MSGAGGGNGAGAAVRAGHLRKLKTMKKKYFVLQAETPDCSARLEYYESEKKYKSGAAPRRVIPLKSCYNITRRLDLKQKHVIALFTKEEQFCVVAENEQDLHGWLAAILKQHRNEDASEELLYPIQHVWQVNVQKKGLGATKNIQGLYNLCLTEKTLTLVKIKSHNNVISDLGIPERVEYSLKNIRRCGDSECFFYMEVGRQTATGAGELWMHSDDSNIAQSMHSTIYHAMRNCAKETENERDHIVIPKRSDSAEGSTLPARRQTYSDGRGRAGLANEKGLCVGSCIRQCVCAGDGTRSGDDSVAALAPVAPQHAENQPPNNSLTEHKEQNPPRVIKHHRTISLPTGCPLFQEPLKIVHERTRSAPLTGDEVARAVLEKAVMHSSCKTVNGTDVFAKKTQWSRRASTGTRLSKLSPAHSKNAGSLRSRCDSMPSRPCSSFEVERPTPRHTELDGLDSSRDEADSVEWHRTPRIPEEPDFCDSAHRDLSSSLRGSLHQHSRTSSLGVDEPPECPTPDGYVPMAPHSHEPPTGLISASSGSVCSGTPSTDPRFSEYQLEPALSHLAPRAYSVGSRPAPRSEPRADPPRHRAYSVGARTRPHPHPAHPAHPAQRRPPAAVCSAPHLPRASADDLMELDFSNNSPAAKVVVSRTPPAIGFTEPSSRLVDEYVDMSPRNAGYVEMRPGDRPHPATTLHHPATTLHHPATTLARSIEPVVTPVTAALTRPETSSTPDGYVEMNYGRAATRPIAIAAPRPAPEPAPAPAPASPDERRRANRTPLGSQTLFPLSLDSPASPPELDPTDVFEDDPTDTAHHPLTTVREISEDGRKSPEVSSSPSYVKLAYSKPIATNKTPEATEELSCNPLATKTLARVDAPEKPETSMAIATVVLAGTGSTAARFSVSDDTPSAVTVTTPSAGLACAAAPALHYAALDLAARARPPAPAARAYTQIDFARTERLDAPPAPDHNATTHEKSM